MDRPSITCIKRMQDGKVIASKEPTPKTSKKTDIITCI